VLRSLVVFFLLLGIKVLSRLFYRPDFRWVGDVPADPWAGHRLVALLNHTSLYEPLFTAGVPVAFLWRIARHGVVPAADKTIRRPLVGILFRLVARHVVPISRERDHTWVAVLQRIDPDSMVVMAPEGRMKRRDGLDSSGQPMTVRGGIADVLEALGGGRMLLAYSGGLHHIQVPGERLPRLWKRLPMRLEVVDIAAYRRGLQAEGARDFKLAVKRDLEGRRDLYCTSDTPPHVKGDPA
jgi:hypothetical protein